ncbi:hypothetical protein [Pontibacter indicus]|uniref:Uncharacterized protein n=1 Tax=Pontibacter indicus TaxID=1317125 RepID=A0A1R3XPY3_9BACT|nr:hypothetical protein [Pontibacter indicus]SIT94000.1 hypothetical protein SAMN05444128_3383 [Pontibacter indicus]
MAIKTKINFERLLAGTELETPVGVGKFRMYKEGNFKAQNVLVEDSQGRMKWYTAQEVQLHSTGRKAEREVARFPAFTTRLPELLYYAM